MAISRTTLTTTETVSASSSTSASVTLNTGDLLVVQVGQSKFPVPGLVTGITWNGHALAPAVSQTGGGFDSSNWSESGIWYYKVATGASATVIITCSGSCDVIHSIVHQITGHDTTTPIGDTDAVGGDNSGAPEPSLTLTTVSGDLVLDSLQAETAATVGAGQTATYQDNGGGWDCSFSVEAASGASTTMSWARSNSARGYAYCAAVVRAAGGGGPFPHFIRSRLTGGFNMGA